VGANAPPKYFIPKNKLVCKSTFGVTVEERVIYKGWNFNSGNYLLTTDTK